MNKITVKISKDAHKKLQLYKVKTESKSLSDAILLLLTDLNETY